MQTSGAMRRENAGVWLLFEIRIEMSPRHCERSEAIHPILTSLVRCGLLRFARNDVVVRVRVLAAGGARGLRFVVPPKGGSRECRMRAAPAVSCARVERKRTRAYRAAEAIRHSLRNGFTAYIALTPGYRAFLPPSPAENRLIRARSGRLAFRRLDADH